MIDSVPNRHAKRWQPAPPLRVDVRSRRRVYSWWWYDACDQDWRFFLRYYLIVLIWFDWLDWIDWIDWIDRIDWIDWVDWIDLIDLIWPLLWLISWLTGTTGAWPRRTAPCTWTLFVWYMMIHDDTWWYMMIHDDTWWYMMIHDDTCWWFQCCSTVVPMLFNVVQCFWFDWFDWLIGLIWLIWTPPLIDQVRAARQRRQCSMQHVQTSVPRRQTQNTLRHMHHHHHHHLQQQQQQQ